MWQQLVVLAIVVASAAYAAWALTPDALRRQLLRAAAGGLARGPGALPLFAARLRADATGRAGRVCDGCPASRRPAPAPQTTRSSR